MNKKESLAFLQSCIDSLNNITDEDRKRSKEIEKKIELELNKMNHDSSNDEFEILLPNDEEDIYDEQTEQITVEMQLHDSSDKFYKNKNKTYLNATFNYAA